MLNQRRQPETMIFDLDGTLFRTETLLLPAYHATFDQLRSEGLFTGDTPPEERILGSLGMLLEHIWLNVMPESRPEAHRRADELFLHYELEGLKQGRGELYPRVAETLRQLRDRGIRLFIASNGLESYVKEVIRMKGLDELFEGMYSAGQYRTASKVDLVRILLDEHKVKSAWMVGDRSSDVEAGSKNGLTVVGCDYAGYRKEGELEGADLVIASFAKLLEYI